MRNLGLILLTFCVFSCQKKNNLVEVKLPEPETETIGLQYENPTEFKVEGKFQLVEIPYLFNELEPKIDGRTMEIHYGKHYSGYTNKLNKLVLEKGIKKSDSIENILASLKPEDTELRNNAGGFYNHSLFFEIITPNSIQKPIDTLAGRINADFGSVDNLKKELIKSASSQFGSGWTWLVVTEKGTLAITNSANQDNPLMPGALIKGTPIIGLDLWEHAYYLKYQNNRKNYLNALIECLNWDIISEKYKKIIKPKVVVQKNPI